MRFITYPAVILCSTVLLAGAIIMVLGRFQIDIWISPRQPQTAFYPDVRGVSERSKPAPIQSPVSVPSPVATGNLLQYNSTRPEAERSSATATATQSEHQGKVRVSNQTDRPVRLALLARQAPETSNPATASQGAYGEPAHWDFAPQEGNRQGLLLSLPEGNLKLQNGDVLVAFAQDGSRQYWGPFVLGETPFPQWDPRSTEWVLILQPQ